MPTARDFITLALKEAGVLGVGQTALDQDMNDCFILLMRMLAQWQKRRWLVPNLIDVSALGNNNISNLIGPGQYYNSARPDKIQAAYFKQLNSNNFVANDVSYQLYPIWSYEDYAKIQLKGLNTWPQYYFYDAAFPYGNVFIWPIPSSAYEIHLLCKGPIGFTIELKAGEIAEPGSLYTDGVYANTPLANLTGFGSGATGDITVAGGFVSTVTIDNPGDGYKVNDQLTAVIPGTGNGGFIYTVTGVTSSLDAQFDMPPEYEEAIHYNLCVRITSMYQYPANPIQGKLAVLALNTIKNANFQIGKLQMPSALQANNGGNFYIFNADQQ